MSGEHYFGDFEAPGAFASALQRRAQASAIAGRREILLFVLDRRHVKWAHNLLLNLHEHGLGGRSLAISSSHEACTALLERAVHDSVSCGRSSYLRRGTNRTITEALNRWRIHDHHVYFLWWQRWHYMASAVRLGYNALSLDTDISLRAVRKQRSTVLPPVAS